MRVRVSVGLALELELALGKLQVQGEKCVLGVRMLVALTTGKTGTDTRILDIANLIFYVNTGVNIKKLDYKKLDRIKRINVLESTTVWNAHVITFCT